MSKTKASIVIIHGPQASGKTSNARRLMEHYGCKRIVDEYVGPPHGVRLKSGDLALTNERHPDQCWGVRGARWIGIKEALHAISGKKPRSQP